VSTIPILCGFGCTWLKEIKVQLLYPLFHTFSGLLFFRGVGAFNTKIWRVIWVFPALFFRERNEPPPKGVCVCVVWCGVVWWWWGGGVSLVTQEQKFKPNKQQ
jgi:hypothetical protein